jgi:hypothetical protein
MDRFVNFDSGVSVSARTKKRSKSSIPASIKSSGRQEKLSTFGFTAVPPKDDGGGDAKRRRISGGGAGSPDDPVVVDEEVAETQYAGLTQTPGFWEQISMDAKSDLDLAMDNEESPRRPRGVMKPRFSPGDWSAKNATSFSPRFALSQRKSQTSATSRLPSQKDERIDVTDTGVRQKTPIPVTSEIHNSDTSRKLMPPPPVTPKRPKIEVPNSQSPTPSPLRTQPTQTPSPFRNRFPTSLLKAKSIVKSSQWYENEDTQYNFSDTESEGEGEGKLQPFFRKIISGSNNDETKKIAIPGATESSLSTSPSVSLAKDAEYLLESMSEASQRRPLLPDSLKDEAPAPSDRTSASQSNEETQDLSASAVPPGSQLQGHIPDAEFLSKSPHRKSPTTAPTDDGPEEAEDISINPPTEYGNSSQQRFWLEGTASQAEDDESESQALMMEFNPIRTQQYPHSMFVEKVSPLSPESSEAGSPTNVSQDLGGLALNYHMGLESESQHAAMALSDTTDDEETELRQFTTTQLLPSSLMESFPMPPPMTQESSQCSNDEANIETQ